MAGAEPKSRASVWPGIAALVLATVYAIALLAQKSRNPVHLPGQEEYRLY